MSYGLKPPPGAASVIESRERMDFREGPVIVSYVGTTPWDAPHVHCTSGQDYDWEWAWGLELCVVLKPGVNARDAILNCFQRCTLDRFLTLIDIERKLVSYVVCLMPERVWHLRDVSAYFPEPACATHS